MQVCCSITVPRAFPKKINSELEQVDASLKKKDGLDDSPGTALRGALGCVALQLLHRSFPSHHVHRDLAPERVFILASLLFNLYPPPLSTPAQSNGNVKTIFVLYL
jgi:hypothetical protein